jgi:cytochrome P450
MKANALAEIPSHVSPDRIVDFDVYAPPGAESDLHAAWVALQRSAPDVIWTPCNGGHWIALRGEDIHSIIADWQRFSNRSNVVPPQLLEGSNFIPIQLDPPQHTPYRNAVVKNFGAKYLMALDEPIRELAVSMIEGIKERGECEFVKDFAEVLPITVFLMLMGLPVSDREMLRALGEQANRPDGSMTGAEMLERLSEYLSPYVEERLASPGEDLVSRILTFPIEGRPWTREEAMRLCRNLMIGGLDTVVAMMSFITLYLARNPCMQDELRARAELIPSAADEFIRRFASVLLVREVVSDCTLRGALLKAGDRILLPTMLHNLDQRAFDSPDRVDIRRGIVQHSTMGNGPHRCVGAALARMEIITFLREWMARIPPFSVPIDAKVSIQAGGVGAVTKLPLRWR